MKTITLQKPDGTTFQVNDRRTKKSKTKNNSKMKFQTFKGGSIQANASDDERPMLPTGYKYGKDGQVETPKDRLAQKDKAEPQQNAEDEDILYPVGVRKKMR